MNIKKIEWKVDWLKVRQCEEVINIINKYPIKLAKLNRGLFMGK